MPNALLARYFEAREVDLGVDFGDLSETQVEPIFEAFTALPEQQQADTGVDFQDINALANDGGIDALRNEAAFYEDATFPEAISAIDGYHAKAMWAFLHKPEYWKGASALLHADTVAGRFWKKRNDLPKLPPHVEEEDIRELEQAISRYFNKTEGRGRNCKVESYRKGNLYGPPRGSQEAGHIGYKNSCQGRSGSDSVYPKNDGKVALKFLFIGERVTLPETVHLAFYWVLVRSLTGTGNYMLSVQ